MISVTGENSVFLFRVIKAGPRCDATELSLSYDGTKFNKVKSHCKKQEVKIYPVVRQLWVKFDITKLTIRPQQMQFKYAVQRLGEV